MGRPKLAKGWTLRQTSFRLHASEIEAIQVAAERDLRSPSSWIRLAVQEKLERDENGKV